MLPNGEASLSCFVWLKHYFSNCGDDQPNRDEVHLDQMFKKEVYADYLEDFAGIYDDRSTLSYPSFDKIWNDCFPYVKIREYKACSGKCETCCNLSTLYGKNDTTEIRRDIGDLKALHRADYMFDRTKYKERIHQAMTYPGRYLSIITDGMQQFHTELPYFCNRMGQARKVKQHLQGLTVHGKRTRLYRTVDHIKNGANVCIYILLLALDEELQSSGSLPRTLYVQVDGGPENANYWFLAWMEILIAIEIGIEEIWICRMRPGHTHADQDARFGLIWLYARGKYLVTPQEYNYAIKDALKDYRKGEVDAETSSAELIDIFVVPDLAKVVADDIDPDRSKAFKGPHAQLVFRFEKNEVSKRFPLGSKCTYRASALDRFVEFVPDPGSRVGVSPRNVFVDWYPKEGTSFLIRMPDLTQITPQPFDESLVKELHESISIIRNISLIALSKEASKDWKILERMLPCIGETADMFVERSGMPMPSFLLPAFKQNKKQNEFPFFSSAVHDNESNIGRFKWMPSVCTGASVKSRFNLKPEAPRVNPEDRSDATFVDQIKRRKGKYPKFCNATGDMISDGKSSSYTVSTLLNVLTSYIGSIIFVAANTWVEYKKPGGWPYEFPIESAYVKGKVNKVKKYDYH